MDLQPIIKWAGGKRWLVRKAGDLFPSEYGKYIEPFLGGAAVYFYLAPASALLSDVNSELINVYSSIKEDWNRVAELLKVHQRLHCSEHYYKVRASVPCSKFSQAARTLYLNRTCWNGLYRVNLKGEFNVPIGTKSNVIADIEYFPQVAELLKGAELKVGDFEESVNSALEGDFVFVDPPYTVKHNYNGFIKYNENLFKWEDQVRLRDSVVRAARRGAKVLVLNANHESIVSLYEGFEQIVLSRSNVLSGKSEFRGVYQELAIKCW
ncbi:TPA: Dam family site-specific DNA-(adenine-N6)-methyltransferase [Pseudomonas aeruginosa]|uniref:DNA adenine methylase n=1 Tax=Pseudomonas aeruginosa TaxID=287 RepID=UPI0020C3B20F|nr:Dam family site-specific DNA-(adenine-N6)-methyltransferase [Pseudomonas aeruginosa]HBO2517902.1 Dam family site-specific DNA-(adenine-N6)-methyltransferase [Pseudomonas aeruginosa]HCF4524586.1 Dam family site-specific DNA-(adenine-N6)-methyltransferase [Pseudomonas aeruginosa]HCF5993653.1 Dam family site-specific DNA-(adenine-N6)-methyltransferase [Pseudomonas aeruginosa]HEJ1198501.1 Dam family site-specific DNA-(adenine-N6)-methyltransferase [Pseudomonas aeruginosa]HEJ5392604.1 Dam family